jgi:hypothetical protein
VRVWYVALLHLQTTQLLLRIRVRDVTLHALGEVNIRLAIGGERFHIELECHRAALIPSRL